MYKRDKMLKEEAEKRLQAIREFTELGSRHQDCHAGSGDPWRRKCSGRGTARAHGGGGV